MFSYCKSLFERYKKIVYNFEYTDQVMNYRLSVLLYHIINYLGNCRRANNHFHFTFDIVDTEQYFLNFILTLLTTNKDTVSKFKTFSFLTLSYLLIPSQIFTMEFHHCLEKSIKGSPFGYKIMRNYRKFLIC